MTIPIISRIQKAYKKVKLEKEYKEEYGYFETIHPTGECDVDICPCCHLGGCYYFPLECYMTELSSRGLCTQGKEVEAGKEKKE
jgi:hypothetical protein